MAIKSHMCECGQVFDSKKALRDHQKNDCMLRGAADPTADAPTDTAGDDAQPDLLKAMEAAKVEAAKAEAAKAEADKQPPENDAPPKAEPPKAEPPKPSAKDEPPAKTDKAPVIIPYSLCDKKIQYLSSTRPIIIGVECRKRDEGLEVRRVLPGWK